MEDTSSTFVSNSEGESSQLWFYICVDPVRKEFLLVRDLTWNSAVVGRNRKQEEIM